MKNRPGCLSCVKKHLSQAIVLLNESKLGHPNHLWIAIGHLAEAEVELAVGYSDFAQKIREKRLALMRGIFIGQRVFLNLIQKVIELEKSINNKSDTDCCSEKDEM